MRVGVIGGGQLGRMLGLAGLPLGLDFTFLDPADAPTASAVGDHLCAPFDDRAALQALAERCDVLTFEFENIPTRVLKSDPPIAIQPSVTALAAAQERALEKTLFEESGIPVAPWRRADSQEEIDSAASALGLPLIAKTRSMGYDGKGQHRLLDVDDAVDLYDKMGGVPLLIERLVDFDREVSVIGSRAADGDMVIYPVTTNQHRNGILIRSETMAVDRELRRQAVAHLRALCTALDYVGTLAIEFFVSGNLLLGNEFAPRVHNSGHWTMDGAPYCQFQNHLRAVCGLPLGKTDLFRPAGMLNLIGEMPRATTLLGIGDSFLHDYQKTPRTGRKLGHLNVIGRDQSAVAQTLDTLQNQLPPTA